MRGVVVLGAVLLLALTGCGEKNPPAASNQDAAGFTVVRDAVAYPSVSDWVQPGQGLRQLLPEGDCVLGVGTYANGHRNVRANWTGDAACEHLALDPPARDDQVAPDATPDLDGWTGGGIGGVAVAWDGGAVIGASGSLARRDPDGTVTELARLPFTDRPDNPEAPDRDPVALSITRAGGRLIVVGNGAEPATAYLSDDGGATVRGVVLPQPETPGLPRLVAADGRSVVATDETGDWLTSWHSADGGETWTVARMPRGEPGQWVLAAIVRAAGAWHALGRVNDPAGPDRPLWLSSEDGTDWTRRDTSAMGEGGIIAATVDRAGALVLVGRRDQAGRYDPGAPTPVCGVLWTGPAGGPFTRGDLDCGENPPTAVATLADGRVLVAGNRDLWIRPAR